ncbi:MAG: heparinase II/III domain-containing protein [Armatimonadota bacterium]
MKTSIRLAAVAMMLLSCPMTFAQPALWFSKQDIPRLQKVIASEPEATVWRGILQRAEGLCTPGSGQYADPETVSQRPQPPWKVQIVGHHLGGRLTTWMETLGIAYQLTGDERFAHQGVLLLDAAVRTLPVTEPDIAQGFAGARGDIMRGFAVGYDWLGEAMTPEQKSAWAATSAGYVRNMLEEAAGDRVWWKPYHNFMGVAIGAAGLLSLELQPFFPTEAPQWREQCAELVRTWLESGFDEQGAYVEGTGYAVYGLSNALRFADALQRAGGPNLFESKRLRLVPHFFAMSLLPGEKVFDARNDANYAGLGDPGMLRLAEALGSGLGKWLWQNTGGGDSPFQIIWANSLAPQTPREAREPLAEHFAGRGLCVWRTGWDTSDVMFSIEAGPYYPVTHNQADEGHFTLYGLGQRWAIDSGYGNNRLPGGRDSTMAHNCILIDGEGMAPSGAGAGTSGKVLTYQNSERFGYAAADATDAYNRNNHGQPGAVVQHARRHSLLVRPLAGSPAYAVVLDDIQKDAQPHDYTWLMHLPDDMRVELTEDGATLSPGSAAAQCFVETPADATGRGETAWTFDLPQAGDYTLWGRVRATGKELGKTDSFLIQVDDQKPVDWHMPTVGTWTWGKIASGVPQQALSFRLPAGPHTVRVMTREAGAQLERLAITSYPDLKPPFSAEAGDLVLLPETASIKPPMALVRTPADPAAPRLRLWLTAAAPLRFSVDGYDGHQRLKASATAVSPEFAAVLLPLPSGAPEPRVTIERLEEELRLRVRHPQRTDQILWPRQGERRPVLTAIP